MNELIKELHDKAFEGMNERIKELHDKAFEGNNILEPNWFLKHNKKFAELIVQRTLAIVESHAEIFQSDQARAMVEHIKSSVKTDFGVEK
jgi:hypothetical protein